MIAMKSTGVHAYNKMMLFRWLSIFLLAIPLVAFGQSSGDKPLDLIHADKIQTTGKDPDIVTNLIGNVHLKYGETDLKSDRALWYNKTDMAIFIGSVLMSKGASLIACQNLTYYRNSGSAEAVGGVAIRDTVENLLLTCSRADYLNDSSRFVATGRPILKINPDDDSSKITIIGDSIIYGMDNKIGYARHNVIITRKNIRATCEFAEFRENGDNIVLTGDPKAVQDKNILTGDKITLRTEKRIIIGMVIDGNASATYRTYQDTVKDLYTEAVLTGKELEVFFLADKPEHAVMRRNAISNYTPSAADSTVKGKNIASGDSITLFFDNSKINRVLIIGGAQGQYIEEKLGAPDSAGALPRLKPETTFYSSQQIDYQVASNLIELDRSAELKYQTMKLNSANIKYNTGDEILIAEGRTEQTDSGEIVEGSPVLFDGAQELHGQRMTYNIATKRGKVSLGSTEFENAYYKGKSLREVSDDVMFVSSGEYTTCEDSFPHYHFYCHKMKMIAKDKIIAKPVVMFIGPLPVMALPYYVFPIRKGRHSGFLTFDFGSYKKGERFIHNLGYYWAASDYWDAQSSFDLEENGKVTLKGGVNYAVRYRLNGAVNAQYTRQKVWNTSTYRQNKTIGWSVGFNHNQTISPTMRLNASGNFLSNKNYNIDNSYNLQERLNRTISSNANIAKTLKTGSISANVNQSWNLDTDDKTQLLPSISYSRNSLPIFPPNSAKKELNKRVLPWDETESETETHWYNSIYISLKSDFQNRRHQFKQVSADSDTLLDWRNYRTLNSQVGLSAPQKLFGILTVNPSMSMTQTIYKIDQMHGLDTAHVSTNGYYRREVGSASVALSTALYGTVNPGILHVTGFRHVMTPSVSYSYSPKVVRNLAYSQYTGVGSQTSKSRSIGMSLNHVFQMKTQHGDKESKFDLVSINSSASYNFEAVTQSWGPNKVQMKKNWSDLSTSINCNSLKIVNLSGTLSHGLYDEITGEKRLLNPWLQSVTFSASFARTFYIGGSGNKENLTEADSLKALMSSKKDLKASGNKTFSVGLNSSYYFSESRYLGAKTITKWIQAALDVNLTAGWRMLYNFHFDLKSKSFSSQDLRITRDMHCWQGEFAWVPTGARAGYYLRIAIKMHPDIKVEQTGGSLRSGSLY
jgi:lipopolysaccharide assembly outer membrane protein LptD (OstA)